MAILIATILAISTGAITISNIPNTAAHTPGWTCVTHAYVQALPDTIGVGQKTMIYMWIDYVFPNAAVSNNGRWHNFNLTITDPENKTTTKTWDVVTDTTSNVGYSFVPDKVGTYTLNFYFPGQNYTQYDYVAGSDSIGDYFLPSNATSKFTVVEDQTIELPDSYPMPTEYWTRPIYGENTYWRSISSNWLGVGAPGYGGFASSGYAGAAVMGGTGQMFPTDAIGPLTPHIMWTKEYQSGGVVGGDFLNPDYGSGGNTFFEGSAYNQRFTNPIIVNGKLVYSGQKGYGSSAYMTYVVDLRTGTTLASATTPTGLSFAYIPDFENQNQHGVTGPILCTNNFGAGYDVDNLQSLWTTATGVPSGYRVMGTNGETIIYSVMANNVSAWNSTKMWGAGFSGLTPSYPSGAQSGSAKFDFYQKQLVYQGSNFTIAGNDTQIVGGIFNNMLICFNRTSACNQSSYGRATLATTGASQFIGNATDFGPYTYFAIDLSNATGHAQGQILWMKTLDPAKDYTGSNCTILSAGIDPINKIFVENYRETNQFVGYNMLTGEKVWGPTPPLNGMDYYGSPASGTISNSFAFGNMYISAYDGIVYCYSAKNGSLMWTYGNGGEGNSTNSGSAVPGRYPTFINAFGADGVVYTVTSEHTIETPIFKGAMARALNATTGQEIWTLSGYTGEFSSNSYAIADGYAVWFNGIDNQIYTVGKGPTQTTVSAPQTSNELGKSLIISGSVFDTCSGGSQDEQIARFPNGLPCAADESMTDWMGYVYQQKPMPTNFTGIKVSIDVIDANGNYRNIGEAKTDATGTYRLTWQPDIPGTYTVFARFQGTNGYYPSYSETGFVVDEPPATPTPTPEPKESVASLYFVPAVVGLFIAIIVVGAAIILVLRKR